MSTEWPTPYASLNDALLTFVEGVKDVLGAGLVGVYLQGSFAVGDFDDHSDVDFVVVTTHDMPDASPALSALQRLHERVFALANPWAQHLEGSYFPQDTLRDYTSSGRPLWYLDHGSQSLIRSDHCNTVVVRWVVRETGITLAGPPPSILINPIPVGALRSEILAVIRDWGAEILATPQRYNNRFYQSFIVLSYCRMLHDFRNGMPGSKRAGADWAKANLDTRWSGLIDRTWAGRPDPASSVRQAADPQDFRATLEFIRYVIHEADQYASTLNL